MARPPSWTRARRKRGARHAGTADAGTADAGAKLSPAVLTIDNVKLAYTPLKLVVGFKVTHQQNQRIRGRSCLATYDSSGDFLGNHEVGPFGVRPGDFDELQEEVRVPEYEWKPTHTLYLYVPKDFGSCYIPAPEKEWGVLLDKTGKRLATGSRELHPRRDFSREAMTTPLAVDQVALSQDKEDGTIHLSYRVTNPNSFRVTASTCLRLFADECECGIDEDSSSSDYSLAPGESITETVSPSLTDEKHWDQAKRIKVYVGPYGCVDSVAEAISNVEELPMPEGIHAPVEPEESSDQEAEPEGEDPGDQAGQ